MTSTKIETYQYLKNNSLIHVAINDNFRETILNNIIQKYDSLAKYNKEKLHIERQTLRVQFKINKYFKFDRLNQIAKDVNISENEVFNHISKFFCRGSNTSKEIILSRYIDVDEFFVEVFALYLAEGDNGSNGQTKPRKLRFTNSELYVIKHFLDWIRKFFPNNEFYFKVLIPENYNKKPINLQGIKRYLKISDEHIRIKICKWKKRTQIVYRICLDSAVLIDLILALENTIKEICSQDKNLARSYLRGMMIGEGTVYNNRSRYVRIEMKNGKEIEYIHRLFLMLGYDCKISYRTTRENMWSIYIGAKQLKKYYDEIGFGVHEKRQEKLREAITLKIKEREDKLGIKP
jgi:DNA-binding transcriptional regulator WhiA